MNFNILIGRTDCQNPCGPEGSVDQSAFAENQAVNIEPPTCTEWNTGFFEKTPNLIGKINWLFRSIYQSIKDLQSAQFAVGQEWVDVTALRLQNIIYTNSTGRPITISVTSSSQTMATFTTALVVDGITVSAVDSENGAIATATTIIPDGSNYYLFFLNAPIDLGYDWLELR